MANDGQTNGHGESRLDRLEGLVEVLVNEHIYFADEHKKLLTAQVVLTDRMTELAEAQKHTDSRLNALINVVDDVVRKRPPQAP
jgi:hypothetical protein